MDRHETAVLLQRGVTKTTIDALTEAGYDSLAAIMRIPQEKIPLILGAPTEDVRAAVRLVGLLADVQTAAQRLSLGWPGIERPES